MYFYIFAITILYYYVYRMRLLLTTLRATLVLTFVFQRKTNGTDRPCNIGSHKCQKTQLQRANNSPMTI